jgi:chromosome segregation ATPase
MTEQQEQTSFFSRIGSWFKKGPRTDGDLPLGGDGAGDIASGMRPSTAIETRSTFLRPWAKRDAAIENVHNGLTALADLMGTIRDNLEKQSDRQQELLKYMSHLPDALATLPENNRIQNESLVAMRSQFEQQNAHQTKLAEILDRIAAADVEQGKTLESLDQNLSTLREHDRAISENLNTVGSAMQSVSTNSAASTQVLQKMRDNLAERDGELERILHRQGNRFTTMLAVAIFLSITALVAVAVIGYLLVQKMH